jgi:hypothetical protein
VSASIPQSTLATTVNVTAQSSPVNASLKAAVVAIGECILRIKKEDIGAHSFRVGVAMAMYSKNAPYILS